MGCCGVRVGEAAARDPSLSYSPVHSSSQGFIQHYDVLSVLIYSFFLRFIYLLVIDIERERERGQDTGRGRSRLHARSPTRDWIPGLQDPWAKGRR